MIDVESDDEDNYFTPISRLYFLISCFYAIFMKICYSSNLAHLFNTTMHPLNQEKSLTFTPVKQPKPDKIKEQNVKMVKVASNIIAFKEVYVFQMKDQKEYLGYGKCGFAFLGNEKLGVYSLMIYRNKENIISITKPNQSLEITIKQNNYISFIDEKKILWTLNFNSETDVKEFVGLVKEKCKCKVIKLVEPEEAKDVKSEETKREMSDDFKTELFQNCIANNDIEFSTSFHNKSMEDSEMSRDSCLSSVPKNIDSDTSDCSEAVLSKKADILSRVAKMGKKIFDEPGDVTDSSDFDDHNSKTSQKFMIKKGRVSKHSCQTSEKGITHPVDGQSNQTDFSTDSHLKKIMIPYNNDNKAIVSTAISSEQLNMFFIDNKNSASEMKLNMMKLQNEVGEVLRIIKKGEAECRNISTQTNNTTLLEENQKLLCLISQQNDTLEKLKEGNKNFRDRNEELVTKATESTYKIVALVEKNSDLNTEIQNLTSKLADQENTLEKLKQKISELTPTEGTVQLNRSVLFECEVKIKDQMNNFFADANETFGDNQQYDGKSIKQYLAQTIIHNTFSVLETIKNIFGN